MARKASTKTSGSSKTTSTKKAPAPKFKAVNTPKTSFKKMTSSKGKTPKMTKAPMSKNTLLGGAGKTLMPKASKADIKSRRVNFK